MERVYLGGLGRPPLYLGDGEEMDYCGYFLAEEPIEESEEEEEEEEDEDRDWDEREEVDECTHGNSKDACEEICQCGHQCSQHDSLDGWCYEKGCQCQSWEER